MAFNKAKFYNYVRARLFGGRLTEGQVQGMEAILDRWLASPFDIRWLAYMLATAFHETGTHMQPVRETYASTDDAAIAILEKSFAKGRMPWVKTPYWRKDKEGKSWLGRGLVQLTHKTNYEKMSKYVGVDLVKNPNAALDSKVAVDIMFEGMLKGKSMRGDFTGVSLEDFFNSTKDDARNARKIINGLESADKVKGYHNHFLAAIKEAQK